MMGTCDFKTIFLSINSQMVCDNIAKEHQGHVAKPHMDNLHFWLLSTTRAELCILSSYVEHGNLD